MRIEKSHQPYRGSSDYLYSFFGFRRNRMVGFDVKSTTQELGRQNPE